MTPAGDTVANPEVPGPVVVLDGGLGNQLFQRAAGCVLERRFGVHPQFSTKWLGRGRALGVTPRRLEIDLGSGERHDGWVPPRLAIHMARSLERSPGDRWLVERRADDSALERWKPDVRFVVGYFQRRDIVDEAWPALRQYLGASPRARTLLTPPRRAGIAVHYRLGDYVGHSRTKRFHGATQPQYFVEAIRLLVDEGMTPVVTVVSDDPAEAHGRLRSCGLPKSVELHAQAGSTTVWEDLTTLSGSDAVVMSNSSFSWWGAYAAWRDHAARVVSPNPWFSDPRTPEPPLIRDEWTSLHREILP